LRAIPSRLVDGSPEDSLRKVVVFMETNNTLFFVKSGISLLKAADPLTKWASDSRDRTQVDVGKSIIQRTRSVRKAESFLIHP